MPRRPITWREAMREGVGRAATAFACAGIFGMGLALVGASYLVAIAVLFGMAWLAMQVANAVPATTSSILRVLEWAWMPFGLLPMWAKFAIPISLVFAGITASVAIGAYRDSRR